MTTDYFDGQSDAAFQPARRAFAVVPHPTNEVDPLPKALYIGTGGNVTLRSIDGSADVVFKNLASGQILDVRAQFVRVSGTTATDIIGLA
ncbi:spike base protein, RCAP_Rcc01079 family [Sphingobium subterraneum]|uniref:Uncharacterized protein n=1 Tax=Sphingobium subterraneum TaxID=627688 RepID=A0A841J3T1_9SPHN|nr:hypothetical protein [Sphingobium subterraneum]MBB6123255.1 hypothetical protein [Sphingobium subterraneum]